MVIDCMTGIGLCAGLFVGQNSIAAIAEQPVFSVKEEACEVSIQHDITVSEDFVRVFDGEQTLYRIQTNGEFWVGDEFVELSEGQQAVGREYVLALNKAVPEVTALVSEALNMAGESVGAALEAAFGADNSLSTTVQTSLSQASEHFNSVVSRHGNEYTLSHSSVDHLDDVFGQEFETKIASAVKESVGSILMVLGKAIVSGDGDFEDRMEAFNQRMESMGLQIEQNMAAVGKSMEVKGEQLCRDFDRIRQLELTLRTGVPSLANSALFKTLP